MNRFEAGQKLMSDGMDMKCNKIEIEVTFVRYRVTPVKFSNNDGHEFNQDCVVEHKGINVIVDSSMLRIK